VWTSLKLEAACRSPTRADALEPTSGVSSTKEEVSRSLGQRPSPCTWFPFAPCVALGLTFLRNGKTLSRSRYITLSRGELVSFDTFVLKLFDNPGWYLLSLFISMLVYLPVIRKLSESIFSPMFYTLLMLAVANAVPIFLAFIGEISAQHFLYWSSSEILFLVGLSLFYSRSGPPRIAINNEIRFAKLLFWFYFYLFIVGTVLIFSFEGIPAFKVSRLQLTNEFTGPLSRLLEFAKLYLTIYSFYSLRRFPKKRFSAYAALLVVIVSSLLSGSKSSALLLVFSFYFYRYVFESRPIPWRNMVKYLPWLCASAMIVVSLQTGNDIGSSALGLVYRLVGNGDIYWMAFGSGRIDEIEIHNSILHLFTGFLSPAKLIPSSMIEPYIGLQLQNLIYPSLSGIVMGPNTRPSILGWVLFRWGGLVFMFILGMLVSLLVFRVRPKVPHSIVVTVLYSFLVLSALVLVTDTSTGLSSFFTLLVNFVIICVLALLFFRRIGFSRL